MRGLTYLAVVGCFALLAAGGAQGAARVGHIGGIVQPPHRINFAQIFDQPPCLYVGFCAPVTYHGGVVMHTTTTHAIFWLPTGYSSGDGMPPFDATYQPLIAQYFQDLEAASGSFGDVYGVDTQYCDGASFGVSTCNGVPAGNHVTTNQTYGGSYVATNAFPANGCADPTGEAVKCLTDAQLQAEVTFAIGQNGGWAKNTSNIYFLYTPEGVESCFDASATACGYTEYCAYHGSYTSAGTVVYANEPYPKLNNDPNAECGVGNYPNGGDADEQLNVTSHEHREAMTDPNLDAWYADPNGGYETSDQCAWHFGPEQGAVGAKYNQTINGDHYDLQTEWSNDGNTCLQTYAPAGGPTINKLSPNHGVIGQPIGIKGKNLTGVTGVKFNGMAATFVQNGKKLSAFVPVGASTGPVQVTTGVGTANGPVFTLDPSQPPTIKKFSPTTATAGDTVTVNGSNFWGTSAVKVNSVNVLSFAVSKAGKLSFVVSGSNTTGTISITTPGGTVVSAGTLTIT